MYVKLRNSINVLRSSLHTVNAMKPMLRKFLVNPSTFALTSTHVAHYVFDKTSGSNEALATTQQYEPA